MQICLTTEFIKQHQAERTSGSNKGRVFQRNPCLQAIVQDGPLPNWWARQEKNQRSTSVWVSLCSKYWSAITLFTLMLMVFRKVTVCVSVEDWSNPVHRTAINTQIHYIHTGKLWIFTGITAQSHLLRLDNVTTSVDYVFFFPHLLIWPPATVPLCWIVEKACLKKTRCWLVKGVVDLRRNTISFNNPLLCAPGFHFCLSAF